MTKTKKWERIKIKLKKSEIVDLRQITSKGTQAIKLFRRARMLLLMHEGRSGREAASAVGVVQETAYRLRRRYVELGLQAALNDEPRPGMKRLLSTKQSQRVVAMVCGPPPEGRAKWTVRLITEETTKRKLAKRIGRETIRLLLQSHDLKPWWEKNVVHRRDNG